MRRFATGMGLRAGLGLAEALSLTRGVGYSGLRLSGQLSVVEPGEYASAFDWLNMIISTSYQFCASAGCSQLAITTAISHRDMSVRLRSKFCEQIFNIL